MDSFLVMPFVEVEMRLGTMSNTFDSNVDKKYFQLILDNLSRGDFTIETKNTIEYINDNVKLIDDSVVMLKENVLKKTFTMSNSPFDLRLSVNQEFLMKNCSSFEKENCLIRKKLRNSFISKHYRYDLTVVDEKKNGISREKHEVEIELIVNEETLQWTSDYIYDFLECKVYDLINIVEPIERDSFKLAKL
jgi:hypothetical protein